MIRKARKPSVLKPGFAYEPGHSNLPFGQYHDKDGDDDDADKDAFRWILHDHYIQNCLFTGTRLGPRDQYDPLVLRR